MLIPPIPPWTMWRRSRKKVSWHLCPCLIRQRPFFNRLGGSTATHSLGCWRSLPVSPLGDGRKSGTQSSGMVLQPAVPVASLRRWLRFRVAGETWGNSSSRDGRATEAIVRTEEVAIDTGEVLPRTGKIGRAHV